MRCFLRADILKSLSTLSRHDLEVGAKARNGNHCECEMNAEISLGSAQWTYKAAHETYDGNRERDDSPVEALRHYLPCGRAVCIVPEQPRHLSDPAPHAGRLGDQTVLYIVVRTALRHAPAIDAP